MRAHDFLGSILLVGALSLGACGGGSDEPADRDAGAGGGGADAGLPGDAGADAGAAEPDAGTVPDEASVGGPCDDTTACPPGSSGTATCREDWPDGYCTVEGCADHGHDCPGDPGLGGSAGESKCVLAGGTSYCLRLCTVTEDCRDGYACAPRPDAAGHGTTSVCVPE